MKGIYLYLILFSGVAYIPVNANVSDLASYERGLQLLGEWEGDRERGIGAFSAMTLPSLKTVARWMRDCHYNIMEQKNRFL
ncbi:hypothetical protein PL78_04560 [Yersinia entomophaga]|uniref:Uncharacterized protein n=1 Tax=Yersinia entomophaga TaxID=935293 RepID=A0ABM6BIK9_YERET|nr:MULTISPECIES: hypothetical protein [Yersinia]ANI29111.1 hypothetical protein PL78_04560 [Yersinia entomophaga]OWF87509.1 hypothetical protein B4914_10990 [Yersinia entomophaga]